MKRQERSILDRVRVVNPCSEDWHEMRGNDEVRFCSHCQKSVHNLSQMTRRDAERLVAKSKGQLCVRYISRADQRVVTASDFPPLHRIARRASRLAASAFSAALTLTTATAQNSNETQIDVNPTGIEAVANKTDAPQMPSGDATIVGTVIDPAEAVVAAAKVTLTDRRGAVRQTLTNEEGVYRLENLPFGVFTLEIESAGFVVHKTEEVNLSGREERRINVTLEVGMMGGAMVIVSPAESFIKHYEDRQALEKREPEGERQEPSEDVQAWLDAAESDELDDVKVKLHEGAAVEERNEWRETALMLGARHNSIVKALLKAGADVNARSEFGVTPLMYATLAEDAATVRLMINAGADVNARDRDGRTALMFAAMEGRAETIEVLLEADAERDVRDRDGKSALDFAREFNQEETIKALKAAAHEIKNYD